MTLAEITLKRLKIQAELNSLKNQEQDLLLTNYRKNIGKYFKHKYGHFSIRIDSIFVDNNDNLVIMGPTYYFDKDNIECQVNGLNQYKWKIESIIGWDDLSLEEISKQEFIQSFYETIGIIISDFNTIIFNEQ